MCGIYCYVGKQKAIPVLIDGLEALEYRGYDSSGIAYIKNNKVNIIKKEGKIKNLNEKINKDLDTTIGIGHTRWATHGLPNEINAHPHNQGKITLVHNGIIENYQELKKLLNNYQFTSETDTEVLTALIDKLYQEKNNMIAVLNKLKDLIKGSYALGIINNDELDKLYAIRKDSPLILANSEDGNFIASDIPAILKYTNKYILLNNNEIACITKENITIYDEKLKQINKKILEFEGDFEVACKNGYEHFMLKEIHEQPDIILKTLQPILEFSKDCLKEKYIDLSKYNKIQIVGCGSAYHVGLVSKTLIEKYCHIPVEVEIASEYRYKKCLYDKKTLVIFISQSGETADTVVSLRKVNNDEIDSLSIVNVVGSSIARESKKVIYTKAGCEIAVATTKAYSAQLATLILICLINSDITINNQDIIQLPNLMKNMIEIDYINIAKEISKNNNCFFIGRGIDYDLSQESSLKLKEISYIHSEAYAAGELKHGTISLIDKDTPVIAISTDKNINEKTISNIKEVKSRGAKVIFITTNNLNIESDFYDNKILIPNTSEILQPLITIIPLQLLAYHVANIKKCDIDKPRNLAKSVTVE